LDYVLGLIVLAALVALVVAGPLRRRAPADNGDEARRFELEAAKEAKYREIRDAELDHRMGKLSEADWQAVNRELRAEAIVILRKLDSIEGREGTQPLP
jgi:hypothetical protein